MQKKVSTDNAFDDFLLGISNIQKSGTCTVNISFCISKSFLKMRKLIISKQLSCFFSVCTATITISKALKTKTT